MHAHTYTHTYNRAHATAGSPHRSIDTIWVIDIYTMQIIFIMNLFIYTRYFHLYILLRAKKETADLDKCFLFG